MTRRRSAALSDPGKRRANNEDRWHADPERGIFLVVDGVGGQAAGEVAADTAISFLRTRLERQVGSPEERLREAIAVANNEIYAQAAGNPEWQGMACVLTAVLLDDRQATVGHVGDSRLYLLQQGDIRKITRDHSPVGELEDGGALSETDAMRHPRRNEVYRDVGSALHTPTDEHFIEVQQFAFPPDAALLLCSDGLSDLVPSNRIREIVESHAANPQAATQALIDAANAAGGKDNVTVVLVLGESYGRGMAVAPAAIAARPAPLWRTSRWLFLLYGALLASGVYLAVDRLRQPPAPPPPVAAVARTLMVEGNGRGQFPSITAALAEAQPGDTVLVGPGEYREALALKPGVTVRSRIPLQAVLRSVEAGALVIAHDVARSRLTGFRLVSDAQQPFAVGVEVAGSDTELEDLVITGARETGVRIRGASPAVLRGCRIENSLGPGIEILGAASPWLSHNRILRNGRVPGKLQPGVLIAGESQPSLWGNLIYENGAEAVWHHGAYVTTTLLRDNAFTPESQARVLRATRKIELFGAPAPLTRP